MGGPAWRGWEECPPWSRGVRSRDRTPLRRRGRCPRRPYDERRPGSSGPLGRIVPAETDSQRISERLAIPTAERSIPPEIMAPIMAIGEEPDLGNLERTWRRNFRTLRKRPGTRRLSAAKMSAVTREKGATGSFVPEESAQRNLHERSSSPAWGPFSRSGEKNGLPRYPRGGGGDPRPRCSSRRDTPRRIRCCS